MPIASPFHPRTSELCLTQEWDQWSGYLAPVTYHIPFDVEYFAIRNTAGVLDISPLFKYEISGPEAARLLNRVMTRDVRDCAVGQAMYSPWCNDDGYVVDDGVICRLARDRYRVTAADPNLRWFEDCGIGMDVEVTDVSADLAALALQGPRSREILRALDPGGDFDDLDYFHLADAQISGSEVTISRTGYTGDLGFELWIPSVDALQVWDALMHAGAAYGLIPAGLAALDVARIEAGLILIEVDYTSAQKAITQAQEYSPFNLGLGWTLALDKRDFIGRRALEAQADRGSDRVFVGLEIDWESLQDLYAQADLPPQVAARASREVAPIYSGRRQVGQVTSSAFSPILKKYIALGTVQPPFGELGRTLKVEVTVEYERKIAPATVVETPFFNPARRRA
jgi:aminomethyltransferase